MLERMKSLTPYVVVFTASGCTLVIEIVAGRILAPTIGVSLYTWTSIIGIVLAGISAGNYVGGRVADRWPHPATLGAILLASAVSSAAILPLEWAVSGPLSAVPIIPRIVLLTTALFIAPAFVMGMVSPVVIKLSLSDLSRTGNVVGKIYAVSTAGSIVGTFLTGFVLVQLLGTRLVILLVSLVLLALALAFGNLWRGRRARISGAIGVGLFAAMIGAGSVSGALDSECIEESNYYCIRVVESDVDGRKVRKLYLDALLHSFVDTDDPLFLHYSYEKVFGDLATMVARERPDMDTLFIGGGGYTMPRFVEVSYPQAGVEVMEIDPAVVEVATDYLALPRDTSIITYAEDARTAIQRLPQGKYELVVGDAFNDVSVPYHLTTMEFNEMTRALLADDGIYAINVVDRMRSGRFLRSMVHTLGQTFPYVYVMRHDDNWDSDERYTFVVTASLTPLDAESVITANLLAGRSSTTRFMPETMLEEWLKGDKVALTDDFVPVDGMLAPLYVQSR